MNEETMPQPVEDAAWASLNTPLSIDELKVFCHDIIRMFRINPMLEFSKFKHLGNNRYQMSGRNSSQAPAFDFESVLTVKELPDGFQLTYDAGIKSNTIFKIEAASTGSKLTITERYERLAVDERKAHMHEVDKSLVVWANYLNQFFITWRRWSRFTVWRWYMKRIWEPMKPISRRITYILLWISVVEVALLFLGVAVYFIEYT